MAERIIRFDNEEFLSLLKQCTDLVIESAKLQQKAMVIAGPVLETKTSNANSFYEGPAQETMEQYYTQLAVNVANLNQFYSKTAEYLIYVGEQINITDQEIAAYIQATDIEE